MVSCICPPRYAIVIFNMPIISVENNKELAALEDGEIQAMIEAGVHMGHAKSKRHPAMEPYIWTIRGGISIIDLIKTKEMLASALGFLTSVSAQGGAVLFVGTRPASRNIVSEKARDLSMPYVIERWIGGTLTNFKIISKRIEMLASLEAKKASGEFDKYTKKERMGFDKEIERLKIDFGGLRVLNKLPAAIFITNVPHESTAVREAARMKIPIVALVDTNADPRLISYPIPANDDAKPAIKYMLGRIHAAIEEGKKQVQVVQEKN